MSEYSPSATTDGSGRIATAARWFAGAWTSRRHHLVLWSFLDQVILSGFGFAVGIATGRLVGIAEFGRFTIAMIFVTLASNLHATIFATPMMTLAGHRERSRSYFGAVVAAAGAGAVAFGVVAGALFALYYGARGDALSPGLALAVGALIAAQSFQLILRRVLFAQRKGRLATTVDLGRYALFVVFVGAILLSAEKAIDTELVLWSLTLSGAVAVVASIATTGVLGVRFRARLLLTASHQHWQIARWFVAVVLVGFAQEQLLVLLAGPAIGDAAVGGLRAAQYLFGPILVLTSAMENVLPVRAAAALSADGIGGLRTFLVRFALPLGAANGALILFAVLPGAMWLALLFGPAYAAYVPVLQILALATAFTLVRDYLMQYFRAVRRTNMIFYAFLSGFAAAAALIYPLVSWFGVEGLAIDAVVSQFTSMAAMAIAVVRHYRSHRRPPDAGRAATA